MLRCEEGIVSPFAGANTEPAGGDQPGEELPPLTLPIGWLVGRVIVQGRFTLGCLCRSADRAADAENEGVVLKRAGYLDQLAARLTVEGDRVGKISVYHSTLSLLLQTDALLPRAAAPALRRVAVKILTTLAVGQVE